MLRAISFGLRTALTAVAFGTSIVTASVGRTQSAPLTGAQRATREQLTQRLADLQRSPKPKSSTEISAIGNRLAAGDFKVGDRFVLTVRRDSVRSDTVLVRDSLRVAVLNLPDFDATGVLRSELEQKVGEHVAKYLRNASVRVSILTRVAVAGAVQKPGFFYLAPDRPISDAITSAGGPAAEANLGQLEIRRGSTTMLTAKASKRAVKEGQTLEQLDVQSGDEIRVPQKRKFNWQMIIQLAFVFTSLLFAFLQFVQWYYNRQQE